MSDQQHERRAKGRGAGARAAAAGRRERVAGSSGGPEAMRAFLTVTACEDLTPRGWHRLAAALRTGDPDSEVTAAWQLKELTRDLYRADGLTAARETVDLLHAWADASRIPELRRFARTIRRWEPEVLAWHTTGGASNGPTEAVNLQIKRVGRGFTNFDNYRLRLLLRCGGVDWHTQPAARLRGRGPRIAA